MRFLDAPSLRTRWLRFLLAWLLVFAPLLGWGALAEDVWERQSFRFDNPILLWLHAHRSADLDRLMLGLSLVGGYPLLLLSVGLCALFWVVRRHHDALFVALCIGGVSALNVTAKIIFQRARPDLWISLAPEPDYSFPSGHAMLSSAFVAMVLALVWSATGRSATGKSAIWRRVAAGIGVIFVLMVGLSRLYLGVHFPSDILAGWLASFGWIALIYALHGQPKAV